MFAAFLGTAAGVLLGPGGTSRRPVNHARCGVVAAAPRFTPLDTPAAYQELISTVANDSISVIKFVSPTCRTCRTAAPLFDRVARRWRWGANFYSLELVRKDGKGKAAGERMKRFYKSRGATDLPFVEVYVGDNLVESLVVPPSRMGVLYKAMASAQRRIRRLRWQRDRRSLLALLERARERQAAARDALLQGLVSTPQRGAASRTAVERAEKAGRRAPRRSSAPMRGATGGRRKGFRGG